MVGGQLTVPKSRRVAVVGGGPAGVATCRFLAEAGHKPVVFEEGTEVGGIWAPEPTNKVVYGGLVTNIPTIAMQSFDLDFPKDLPSYIKTADLGRYIASYADHFSLRQYLRLRTCVTSIHPCRSEEEEASGDSAWEVAWRSDRGEDAEQFDAVVVAKGHYDDPYAPEIPGQAAWLSGSLVPGGRTVLHSREYDDPARFASRSVLVVGGRSSAVDIAKELRETARWVYVLEKGCKEVTTVGTCTHLPLGAEMGADGFMRVGGEAAPGPPVEDLILATGYTYVFPFLDAEELKLDFGPHMRFVEPLYQHVVHARRPSLCFIGIPLAVPCPVPLFEAQARFVASHLRGDATSSTASREAWVEARKAEVGERPQDLHFLSGNAWAYMREMTRLSGMVEKEYEAYDRRVNLVTQVYEDRCRRRPAMPWDDDTYRKCQYSVDWKAGTWTVDAPDPAAVAL